MVQQDAFSDLLCFEAAMTDIVIARPTAVEMAAGLDVRSAEIAAEGAAGNSRKAGRQAGTTVSQLLIERLTRAEAAG